MALKLMYITNDPVVAGIAESAGVERIFVDMEYIGKADRQGGMNTVQSHHTLEDVRRIRSALTGAELLVRVNPIHEKGTYLGLPHGSSEEEIEGAIAAGADMLMLPYFKTPEEVSEFVRLVAGRAKTMLLLETAEAAERVDEITAIPGVDSVHIGINDLSLSQGKRFMFEQLADGTCEELAKHIRAAGLPFGIGGIAAPGKGTLPAEYIIREHYRLGSTCAILSRSFCNTALITEPEQIRRVFTEGIPKIRAVERECASFTEKEYSENHKELQNRVRLVLDAMNER